MNHIIERPVRTAVGVIGLVLVLLTGVLAAGRPAMAVTRPMRCTFGMTNVGGAPAVSVGGHNLNNVDGATTYIVERRVADTYWWRGTMTPNNPRLTDGALPAAAVNVDYRIRAVGANGVTIAQADCTLHVLPSDAGGCDLVNQPDGSYLIGAPTTDRSFVTRKVSDGGQFWWRGVAVNGKFVDSASPTGSATYRFVRRNRAGAIIDIKACVADQVSCLPYTPATFGPPGWDLAGDFTHLADGSAYFPVVNALGQERTARWLPHKHSVQLVQGRDHVAPQFILPNGQHVVLSEQGNLWSLFRLDGAGNLYPIVDWQDRITRLDFSNSVAFDGKVYAHASNWRDPAAGNYRLDLTTYKITKLGVDERFSTQAVDGRFFFTVPIPALQGYGSELHFYDPSTGTVERAKRLEQTFAAATGGTIYNVVAGTNSTIIVSGYIGFGSDLVEIDVRTMAVRPIAQTTQQGRSFNLVRSQAGKALNERGTVYFNYSYYEVGETFGLIKRVNLQTAQPEELTTKLSTTQTRLPMGYTGEEANYEDEGARFYGNFDTGEYVRHPVDGWSEITQAYDGTVLVSRNALEWFTFDSSCAS